MTDSQLEALNGRLNTIEQNISRLIESTTCKCDSTVAVNGFAEQTIKLTNLQSSIDKINLEGINISNDVSASKVALSEMVTNLNASVEFLKDRIEEVADSVAQIQGKIGVSSELVNSTVEALSSVNSRIEEDIAVNLAISTEKIGQVDSAAAACNTKIDKIQASLDNLSQSNISLAKEVATEINNTLIDSNKNLAIQNSTMAILDDTTKTLSQQISRIKENQERSKQIFETFVANGSGYNAIYELMQVVNSKIATSYETFVDLAVKVSSSQYEINAGTSGIVTATEKLIDSVNDINNAVILLKDFYPNLLESQHVCEDFSRVIPSLDKFNEVLDKLTDKKLKNVSFSEKVDFANMLANSVNAISESVATVNQVKGGKNW